MKLKLTGILLAVLSLCASEAFAERVSRDEARKAAHAFAVRGKVFGAKLGSSVESVSDLIGSGDDAAFYAVKMAGGGTLVTSGDTEFEPIIAIFPEDTDITKIDPASPMWTLLNRYAEVQRKALADKVTSERNRTRWSDLVRADSMPRPKFATETAEITDMRVPVLLASKWSQSGGGENYYTPNNYVCGCVATAMSQIMRYHEWPKDEVEKFSVDCFVDGVIENRTAIGGVYDWENMLPINHVAGGIPESKMQAIGRLTYECGISVGMDWGRGGSGAVTAAVEDALKRKFHYANAVVDVNYSGLPTDSDEYLGKKVFASLDARAPVQFGISYQEGAKREGGHSIVGDGYGFIDETSYVHLNMGWGGSGDAWFHLPEIDYKATVGGPNYTANTIETVIYNIFPEKSGNVISGRALDEEGKPLEGAKIMISGNGTDETVETSEYGVWAAVLDFPGTYEVSAVSAEGDLMGDLDSISLGTENSWGNDIVLTNPSVRNATTGEEYSTLDRALQFVKDGDELVVYAPTRLKKSVAIAANCTIVAENDATVNNIGVLNEAMITVPTGVTLSITNVCFVGQSDVLVSVETEAKLAIGQVAGVGAIRLADANGLDLIGEIDNPIYVHSAVVTEDEPFATYSCDLETAEKSAMYLLNAADDELGGVVVGDKIVWSSTAPVPDEVATVRLGVDGDKTNYRSLRVLLKRLPEAGDVDIAILKDELITDTLTVADRKVTIFGELDEPSVVQVDNKAIQFVCETDGELVLTNVTIVGVHNYQAKNIPLFAIEGGTLTLEDSATVRDHITAGECPAGAIHLKDGVVTLEAGASIENCEASSGVGCGGGVRVDGGTLELKGGAITNCKATLFGNSVFVNACNPSAQVTFAGAPQVGDLYVSFDDKSNYDPTESLKVVGIIEDGAKIGVKYHGLSDADHNQEGTVFAQVDPSLSFDEEAAYELRKAFVNGYNRMLGGELNGNTLVWGEGVPPTPEPGDIRVITGNVTNEFMTIEEAFKSITADCRVELVASQVDWVADLKVDHDVLLTTAPDCEEEMAWLWRMSGRLEIGKDGSLTLEKIAVNGLLAVLDETRETFYVNGGKLTLGDRTTVMYSYGAEVEEDDGAQPSAIYACRGATVTMLDGSLIFGCDNEKLDPSGVNNGFAGAILAVGSTVNLFGGAIIDNSSSHAGAVYLRAGSKGYLGGNVYIADNLQWNGEDDEAEYIASDIVVDSGSTLSLVSPLGADAKVGRAYCAVRNQNDTDYVAQIDDTTGWTHEELFASLPAFFHDADDSAVATLVTNSTTKALIVWNTALQDGLYTAKDGTVYAACEGLKPTPLPIAFTAISIDEDDQRVVLTFETAVKGCTYTIWGSPTLKAEDFTKASEFVHDESDPEITVDLPIGNNRFWKATAE